MVIRIWQYGNTDMVILYTIYYILCTYILIYDIRYTIYYILYTIYDIVVAAAAAAAAAAVVVVVVVVVTAILYLYTI